MAERVISSGPPRQMRQYYGKISSSAEAQRAFFIYSE